ncbi:hypothetical protein C900_02448 [Fulvivirga imtechensis AK7]|uniref:Uncharacterized protein n=1 Tax=Fulvivirga imtechensis AK7 TaxID=1237149 RepID=L8JRZ7_9BACT|nr:hypothetical protein C900_02448 [Fulvivirga imtechensis AK7]
MKYRDGKVGLAGRGGVQLLKCIAAQAVGDSSNDIKFIKKDPEIAIRVFQHTVISAFLRKL